MRLDFGQILEIFFFFSPNGYAPNFQKKHRCYFPIPLGIRESFREIAARRKRVKDNIGPQGQGHLSHQELGCGSSQAETTDKTGITGGLESQGLHGKSPPVHPGDSLDNRAHGRLHVLSLGRGQNDIGPVQVVK